MTVSIAVTGAAGRMGEAVIETVTERDDAAVAFGVDATDVEAVHGVPVEDPADFPALLDAHDPDVVIDFSIPEAAVEFASACAEAGVPLVTGTTGHDDDQFASLEAASEDTAVLKATNFARGVQALLGAVTSAVEALPGYDVEVTETHHNNKRDAPSGTANTILETIKDADPARADAPEEYGREGLQPREEGEIGVHVRRAGDIRGEHEVMLAGNDEVVKLAHRAEDRGVFAAGAVDAAVWLVGRDAGWYDFADVVSGE